MRRRQTTKQMGAGKKPAAPPPPGLTAEASPSFEEVFAFGGTITLGYSCEAFGGTLPYSYSWSGAGGGGSTPNSASTTKTYSRPAGTPPIAQFVSLTCTVTDAGGASTAVGASYGITWGS